jgi:hypothetical protein
MKLKSISELSEYRPEEIGIMLSKMQRTETQFPPIKRRYSVVGDILAYRHCKRQYGFFVRRKYSAAQSGQLFFGSVIHETLDRAHAHYRGDISGIPQGSIPTDKDIERYFLKAESSLRAQGIRPLSKRSREKALEYVKDFNKIHGPYVYPCIVDTEHRLECDKGNYVLRGVVDVVAMNKKTGWQNYEIWDYKGAKYPKMSKDLENYEFQMRVYAHLYELRNKVKPSKAVLWFLAEKDPKKQRVVVILNNALIQQALNIFERTVEEIENSILKDDWSNISNVPSDDTCTACDIRWNCKAKRFKIRAIDNVCKI